MASSTVPIQVTTKTVSITVPASVTNAEIAVAFGNLVQSIVW
ncbi:hypothetical protein [Paenibacillus germinis]|nr:hypothetical protein [Paenibacillus germinis]